MLFEGEINDDGGGWADKVVQALVMRGFRNARLEMLLPRKILDRLDLRSGGRKIKRRGGRA